MKIKIPGLSDHNFLPIQKVVLSFIVLIITGSILLLMPFSTYNGITVIDSCFTSTSAVCVTGLIVRDTAKDFTLIGKLVILALIQLGGFGIMTFSLGLLSLLGGNLSIKWRFAFEGIYSEIKKMPIKSILIRVIKYTFAIEFLSASILFTQFYRDFPVEIAIGHSVFHAVSAFCNAGFSTFSNNLEGYRDNIVVNLVVGITIILGGLGFIVLNELAGLRGKPVKMFSRLSLHTRLVLIITCVLIFLGTAGIFVLEHNTGFKDIAGGESLMISFFHSVTCRTAGFNTIGISSLRDSTKLLMIFLMFIGGSPGSIAGGIKTTTIGVIFLLIYAKIKGHHQIIIWNRSLDQETVDRSTTLTILSIFFVLFTTFLMLAISDFNTGHSFLSLLFEVVSAFGTVGLSVGITPQLPDIEKVLMVLVMLIGRLGPLTLIMALTSRIKDVKIEFPSEHIMIG